jgi:DNA-3-methyladenine glycosylase
VKRAFFQRPVVEVARDLVGCVVTHGDTEAYHHSEPACHAYVGVTPRTRVLFGPPGRAYVYFSYGVHWMLNAVCEPEGVGAAALIRALEPLDGIELMRERRGHLPLRSLCSGPGKLTQALGIGLQYNGEDLARGPVTIEPRPVAWREVEVAVDRRIGITKAVDLPWRFCARGSRFLSRPVRRADSAGRGVRTSVADAAAAGAAAATSA